MNRRFYRRRSGLRRLGDLFLTLAVIGLLAMVVAHMPPMRPAEKLHGVARVADGDSLVLDGVRIRLQGIDAPELAQTCKNGDIVYPCGRQAAAALARLVGDRAITCQSYGHDRYGRTLARCMAATTELNSAMVEAGWAVAYGAYEAQETQARKAGRGLWRGDFMRPQEWRRAHDELSEEPRDLVADFWGWLRGRIGF